VLRQNASGSFLLGGLQYPINLIVAEPVSGGYGYIVVTAYEETNQVQPSLDFPFAAAVLRRQK
jgi:hypothetical protein